MPLTLLIVLLVCAAASVPPSISAQAAPLDSVRRYVTQRCSGRKFLGCPSRSCEATAFCCRIVAGSDSGIAPGARRHLLPVARRN